MDSHYIAHKQSRLHYRKFGNGPKLLFCFHGYGRESESFYFLQRRIGTLYTIIAIDAPHHGLSNWKEDLVAEPKLLVGILKEIATSLNLSPDRFSLLGFSMGGRLALHLTQLIPEKIERLILIAPDGLNFSFWRWVTTETMLGGWLLTYTIDHPGWALWVINMAEKLKVIHTSLGDFIRYYVNDKDHRIMLYRRWIAMRKFSPNLKKLKRLIRKHNIQVRMMFGAFDRVIPSRGGKQFRKGIEEYAKLQVVQSGHNLLGEFHAGKIAELFTR